MSAPAAAKQGLKGKVISWAMKKMMASAGGGAGGPGSGGGPPPWVKAMMAGGGAPQSMAAMLATSSGFEGREKAAGRRGGRGDPHAEGTPRLTSTR
jgi:hypothetical protein